MDTRAYRFKPLQTNIHTIFEIDLPVINRYKEEILKNEKAYCKIVRIDTDLSKSDWSSNLIRSGYSKDIPTFWVLEGLAYYIEKESVISLLTRIKEISAEKSQIFVDIMQASRWYPFPYISDIELMDPYSRHLKWGLNIKEVPAFFAKIGWRVNCCFADDYDQGRNVGQKGMIFVHGEYTNSLN